MNCYLFHADLKSFFLYKESIGIVFSNTLNVDMVMKSFNTIIVLVDVAVLKTLFIPWLPLWSCPFIEKRACFYHRSCDVKIFILSECVRVCGFLF